jgi:hypothetical protein
MATKSRDDLVDFFAYESPEGWHHQFRLLTKKGVIDVCLLHERRGRTLRFSMPLAFPGRCFDIYKISKREHDLCKLLLRGNKAIISLVHQTFLDAESNATCETCQTEGRQYPKLDVKPDDPFAEGLHIRGYLALLFLVFFLLYGQR